MLAQIRRTIILVLILYGSAIIAQESSRNPIPTAIPFLRITPDAKAAGLGEQGVATPPDAYSQQWNPAKYPFSEAKSGVGVSYTPYLSQLVNDIFLSSITFYRHINDRSSWASSLKYFSLGKIEKTSFIGGGIVEQGIERPNEFTLDLSYAILLTDNFSFAVSGRFIRSDLRLNSDGNSNSANTIGADISGFYQGNWKDWDTRQVLWRYGFSISNLGPKLSYVQETNKSYFIPTNLALGTGMDIQFEQNSVLGIYFEFNKLLVPTPNQVTKSGLYIQPDIGFLEGLVTSFSDAPGGFGEELREVSFAFGLDYRFLKQFSLRCGYFGEHKDKGPRRHVTFGTGLANRNLRLNLSYLFSTSKVSSPLENTLRISVSFLWD